MRLTAQASSLPAPLRPACPPPTPAVLLPRQGQVLLWDLGCNGHLARRSLPLERDHPREHLTAGPEAFGKTSVDRRTRTTQLSEDRVSKRADPVWATWALTWG